MDNVIHRLEQHLLRGPSECAKLLGVVNSTYFSYRAGGKIPASVELHADLLTRIPGDLLLQIERERLA